MNILAIDTSTTMLSLALTNEIEYKIYLDEVVNSHSEYIIQKINELFNTININKQDLSLIIYNKGPGSFTGIRIGLSVAIGIATGLNIPLVAISSFELYANYIKKQYRHQIDYEILTVIDARLNQIYVARHDYNLEYSIKPCVVDVDYLLNNSNLFIPQKLTIITGNGLYSYPKLKSILNNTTYCIDSSVATSKEEYPNAINLLELYQTRPYNLLSPTNVELLYLRDKVALNLIEQKSL